MGRETTETCSPALCRPASSLPEACRDITRRGRILAADPLVPVTWSEIGDPASWSSAKAGGTPTWLRCFMLILLTGFLWPLFLLAPRVWWKIVKP